jgi:hypothetical protein
MPPFQRKAPPVRAGQVCRYQLLCNGSASQDVPPAGRRPRRSSRRWRRRLRRHRGCPPEDSLEPFPHRRFGISLPLAAPSRLMAAERGRYARWRLHPRRQIGIIPRLPRCPDEHLCRHMLQHRLADRQAVKPCGSGLEIDRSGRQLTLNIPVGRLHHHARDMTRPGSERSIGNGARNTLDYRWRPPPPKAWRYFCALSRECGGYNSPKG